MVSSDVYFDVVKIWKVLLFEVFLLVGFLTELCLYIVGCQDVVQLGGPDPLV